ncbi:MAG: transposase [Bacteroidales bacterium]|nr:transposase [Bacteroidales bacterium]
MKLISTYGVRLHLADTKPLTDTVRLYREAVSFFLDVIEEHWNTVCDCTSKTVKCVTELLTHKTSHNPYPTHNFDERFPNFPCYLRRAAIAEAFGMASSYHSNLNKWLEVDKKTHDKKPSFPKVGNISPTLYNGNCFMRTGVYAAKLKVWVRNTWDWVDVTFRKTDITYIQHHCSFRKECAPTLRKRGKNWELDFPFEENVKLQTTPVEKRRIVAVDLGINNAATCCVMESDGAVVGREFLSLTTDNGSLNHTLALIKRAQRSGARQMPELWAKANGINRSIAEKTATFIVNTAVLYDADVVVMEHLDLQGKKKGSKRHHLALWKAKYVQKLVEDKCHHNGMRISTICAWNTSRLAFDGSGFVKRGRLSEKTGGSYSVCEFTTGKVYNCDLNASYNIGARYFIREILGSMPERARLLLEAKVPLAARRSTCTLSTLYDLRAAIDEQARVCAERTMSGEARASDAPKGQPRMSLTAR